MNVILQSNSVFMEVGELDTESGMISASRKIDPSMKTDGIYEIIDGDILAIYHENGKVYGKISNTTFEIGDEISATIAPDGSENILSIIRDESPFIEYRYTPKPADEGDPTPFVESEDVDFCVFFRNIINTPERRELFIS